MNGPVWRRSCHANGQCVEVGGWRASSRSGKSNCVEVARPGSGVAVRDSKHPHLPHLTLTARQFGGLINHLKEN